METSKSRFAYALLAVVALSGLSQAAKADWVLVNANANGESYMWNPVKQYYPYAYPVTAALFYRPIPVAGWTYSAQSMRAKSVVNCNNGALKLLFARAYAGEYLTGASVRLSSLTLRNGQRMVPGRWYAYSRLPTAARAGINFACE